LLTSLVPEELTVAIPNGAMADAVASMSCKAAGSRLRWALIVSVGALAVASSFLFIMIHRPHTAPTPSITKSQAPAPSVVAPAEKHYVAAVPKSVSSHVRKPLPEENDFMALDDGPPVQDGTIVRINMPASFAPGPGRVRHGKGVPADVLVDETGQVRAIRFVN
jgi:hypothetical protein